MGKAALRKGKWKIVNMPINQFGKDGWELFDLSIDPGEVHDLAEEMPGKVEEMVRLWDRYVGRDGHGLERKLE